MNGTKRKGIIFAWLPISGEQSQFRRPSTTAKEAGALLRAIDECSGYGVTKLALRMTPHVFVRPAPSLMPGLHVASVRQP